MPHLRCTVIALLLLASISTTASAQAVGSVAGQVLDQTGAALPGAVIELVTGTSTRETVSSTDGRYVFESAPAGGGLLIARLLDFAIVRREITIRRGLTSRADIRMTLALSADVIVTAPSSFRNVADVENPAESLVGVAAAASQGAITAEQLRVRPIMRPGEVLETVPGLIVSQHSGDGKANQYYLRGFNLDHGTDFSMSVASVPVNMPTGAHAHGYADANFLIPELIGGVQFRKGPYYADDGDFSAAGSSTISYVTRLDHPLVSLAGGTLGWTRLFAASSPQVAGGTLLNAVEAAGDDGPWTRGDRLRKLNAVLRYSRGTNQRGLALTAMGYGARWHATDQVPERAILDGSLSRYSAIDDSDRGASRRLSLAADGQVGLWNGSLRATGFALDNRLTLYSNFTYFLDNPIRGDQFEQSERRQTVGGRVTYRRLGHLFDRHAESAAGIQVRRDVLDPVGLYRTEAGRRFDTVREDVVHQAMIGTYAQTEVEWTDRLRTTTGLRMDTYRYTVASDGAHSSGRNTASLTSPKFGAVIGPWRGTEIYLNAGMGFHSNDARGAVVAGTEPENQESPPPVTPLVRARGAEVGLRTVALRGVQSTISAWYLDLASELVFVGDAGTTEAGRPSRRAGLEWTNYARIRPWLVADLDLSVSRARFRDADPAGVRIPGALDRVLAGGLTVTPNSRISGSLRVRHFGPRPLVENGSQRSAGTTLWNGEISAAVSRQARVVVDAYNLFNVRASDIDYFYTSRLPGEPPEGVEDVHTHPAIPRTARLALVVSF